MLDYKTGLTRMDVFFTVDVAGLCLVLAYGGLVHSNNIVRTCVHNSIVYVITQ